LLRIENEMILLYEFVFEGREEEKKGLFYEEMNMRTE
jgi:hypothetical protein